MTYATPKTHKSTITLETFHFEHSFPNDDHEQYAYSNWTGFRLVSGEHVSYQDATRIVVPRSFLPALELYKVLLGEVWYHDKYWPEWLLEECRDSGMHIDCLAGFDLEAVIRKKQAGQFDPQRSNEV